MNFTYSSSQQDYYPFGWKLPGRNLQGAEDYRYGYQGQFAEEDHETQWNQFEARMYDARVGRWMSTDPAGQHPSPYMAMGNDPTSTVDPDGRWGSKKKAIAAAERAGYSADDVYKKKGLFGGWGFSHDTVEGIGTDNIATVSTFINKNKKMRSLDLPAIITTAPEPGIMKDISASNNLLVSIPYDIVNGVAVAGQDLLPGTGAGDLRNIDGTIGVSRTEREQAWINTLSLAYGGMTSGLTKSVTVVSNLVDDTAVLSYPANQTLYKQVLYPLPRAQAGGQFWMGKWYNGGQIMKGEFYLLQKGNSTALHTISVPQNHPIWMKMTGAIMIPATVNWGYETAKQRK